MIDNLIGLTDVVPIADQSAATVTLAVFAYWIASYNVPKQLHSKRGTQYSSALFAELCLIIEVDKTRTIP